MSKNERKTENVVRDELRRCGYYESSCDILVEEQKSNIDAVRRLLRNSSKGGGTGSGAPEFIVSSPSSPDFLLIVECKADAADHESPLVERLLQGLATTEEDGAKSKRVQRFAVDGALHYAKALSREYNVIAIAVSGETRRGARITTFLHPKAGGRPKRLSAKDGAELTAVTHGPTTSNTPRLTPVFRSYDLTS